MQKLDSVADRLEGKLAAGTRISLLPGSVHTAAHYAAASLREPIPYYIDFGGNLEKQVLNVSVDYEGGVFTTGNSELDILKAVNTIKNALRPYGAIYHNPFPAENILFTRESAFTLGQDYPFDGKFAKKQVFRNPNRAYLTEVYASINFQHFPEEILAKIREMDIEKNQLIIWLGAGKWGMPGKLDTIAFISATDQGNNKLGVLILESKIGYMQKP